MKLPQVYGAHGAPLGRPSEEMSGFEIESGATRFTLRRVPIDAQGYDNGGAYWGIGEPLFFWSVEVSEGDNFSGYFRAANREAAKAFIRGYHWNARFFN